MATQALHQAWGEYQLYSLHNAQGSRVDVSDLGATIVNFWVRGGNEKPVNVVMGFASPEHYFATRTYMGAVVGPWANRIRAGRFELDGRTVQLAVNENGNHLHGASGGLHLRRWRVLGHDRHTLTLACEVAAGEAGYPANLQVTLTMTFDDENRLLLEYQASVDRLAPINLTQHSYFNLSGGEVGIAEHLLSVAAHHYLAIDAGLLPTARLPVAGSAMDLRLPVRLGERIDSDEAQVALVGGFDHCWCLDQSSEPAARLVCPHSGLALMVQTDQPGIQVYTGNALSGEVGHEERRYGKHSGICLETQCYPDQVNMPLLKGDCLYSPQRAYHQRTSFQLLTL